MLGLLSLPTWFVHFASLIEWAMAIYFIYMIGQKLNNIWLKRMPWAMLPYMLSGVCAIWYHFTYDTVGWLSDAQSYLTFLGSACFGVWGYFFLRSAKPKLFKRGGMTERV
ncbi:DUF2499 domain-containing protein [Heliobacterium chlorum]|uniref:DUF2499 domain-containing protein n=1 Tax=Heliobacterium chlorum TaxID=2698 RepID=A0ABR7T8T3_HELCL|nr:DUF2499 domain-containing protein [Heliobacterium chlorum]MBC9786354.1 DUF2499 domain-containing protein [Heliobacterium chlorum]